MRRHRRILLTERLIPFLAALVGLLALAGAVLVQVNAERHAARLAAEMQALEVAVEQLKQRADELAAADDDGTAEGLLALQERLQVLEEAWETLSSAPPPAETAGTATGAAADNPARVIDPSWPTENCIPTGTRFIAMPNESYPICESPAVVRLSAITEGNVVIDGGGVIGVNGIGALPGTSCSASLLSADAEGFAELRVTCQ